MREPEPRRQEPVLGRDYMIDYYALLGVKRTADVPTIEKAWFSQMRMYHEDRYGSWAPPEFREKAQHMGRVLGAAKETLIDPDRRAAYNLTFAAWTGAVSIDGYPVAPREELKGGIRVTDKDFDAKLGVLLTKANSFVSSEPTMLKFIEDMYYSTGGADAGVLTAYKNALSRQDDYLSLQEFVRRLAVGMETESVDQPEKEYLDLARAEIVKRREELERELELESQPRVIEIGSDNEYLGESLLRLMQSPEVTRLLGGGELLSLPPGPVGPVDASGASKELEVVEEAPDKEFYLQRFDAQAAIISELAQEREELIAKRLTLVKPIYEIPQPEIFDRAIICLRGSQDELRMAFSRVDEGVFGEYSIRQDTSMTEEDLSVLDTASGTAELIKRGYNVFYMFPDHGLPIIAELEQVLNAHFEKYEAPN